MPLVVFGAGMIGADNVPFADHMPGVMGRILKHLRLCEGRGEYCVVIIDEYETSKVSIWEIGFSNSETNHPIYQGVSTLDDAIKHPAMPINFKSILSKL